MCLRIFPTSGDQGDVGEHHHDAPQEGRRRLDEAAEVTCRTRRDTTAA